MQTITVDIDRAAARELWRKYKAHLHYSSPIDHEIRLAYHRIAQGHTVIRALGSIAAAGVDTAFCPKLAIAPAHARFCDLRMRSDGSAQMMADTSRRRFGADGRHQFSFEAGTFPRGRDIWNKRAMVPIIPVYLRPKRGIENYHILWEAEWSTVVPRDPLLLRRIGRSDMWLVVAGWGLTEVERAALATRVNVRR